MSILTTFEGIWGGSNMSSYSYLYSALRPTIDLYKTDFYIYFKKMRNMGVNAQRRAFSIVESKIKSTILHKSLFQLTFRSENFRTLYVVKF